LNTKQIDRYNLYMIGRFFIAIYSLFASLVKWVWHTFWWLGILVLITAYVWGLNLLTDWQDNEHIFLNRHAIYLGGLLIITFLFGYWLCERKYLRHKIVQNIHSTEDPIQKIVKGITPNEFSYLKISYHAGAENGWVRKTHIRKVSEHISPADISISEQNLAKKGLLNGTHNLDPTLEEITLTPLGAQIIQKLGISRSSTNTGGLSL